MGNIRSNALEVLYGLAGVLGALATVPQAIKVWHTHTHHVDGMSLATWGAYLMIGLIGLAYGVVNQKKALILSSGSYVVMYLIVVLGILANTSTWW